MINIGNTTTRIHRPQRSRGETADPEEMRRILEEAYGVPLRLSASHDRPAEGARYKHIRTDFGSFAIDEVEMSGEVTAELDPLNKVMVVWVRSGTIGGHCDGIDGKATADEVTLLAQPDLSCHTYARDVTATTVLIDPAVIAAVATGSPVGELRRPVRFTSFQPVDSAAVRLWKDTVAYVTASLTGEDDAMATPLVLGHVTRLLAAVTLAAFPHDGYEKPKACDRTDDRPAVLRRAIEFIESNAKDDIALPDVAAAVHVTPRAVQYMFRRHLDTTPMQYLRSVRLREAHRQLVVGDRRHETVTSIAANLGFTHTGRFSVLYRQTYGRSPHETLRS